MGTVVGEILNRFHRYTVPGKYVMIIIARHFPSPPSPIINLKVIHAYTHPQYRFVCTQLCADRHAIFPAAIGGKKKRNTHASPFFDTLVWNTIKTILESVYYLFFIIITDVSVYRAILYSIDSELLAKKNCFFIVNPRLVYMFSVNFPLFYHGSIVERIISM